MGLYQSIKLGPYVRTKTQAVDTQEPKRTCSNPLCRKHEIEVFDRHTSFCPLCGSAVQERQVPVKGLAVSQNEVLELLDGSLMPPCGDGFYHMAKTGTSIWVGNKRVPGLDRRIEPADATETEITPALIAEEIERFSDFYEKELVILRQEYGDENVEVVWGLLNYVS